MNLKIDHLSILFKAMEIHCEKKKLTLPEFKTPELEICAIESFNELEKCLRGGVGLTLKDRCAAMLYLDKLSVTREDLHPDCKYVDESYCGTAGVFASLELIRLLSLIKDDASLSVDAVDMIENWVTMELDTLYTAILIRYFKLYQIRDFRASGTSSKSELDKKFDRYIADGYKAHLDEIEQNAFSLALVRRLKQMNPREFLKIPAGCQQHETRIIIEKIEDEGEIGYKLFHSNTGYGSKKFSTVTEYSPLTQDKLEDPIFWAKFLEAIRYSSMKQVNNLLDTLTDHSKPVPNQKAFQKIGSCGVKAIENDLKLYITSQASSAELGFGIYKTIKNLMISKFQEELCSRNLSDFRLQELISEKELVRKRYLTWIKIASDQKKFQEVQTAYLSAFKDFGKKMRIINFCAEPHTTEQLIESSMESVLQSIKGLPNLMVLKILDKAIDSMASFVGAKDLDAIRNAHSELLTFDEINYLALRPKLWLKNTRALLERIGNETVGRKISKFFNRFSACFFSVQKCDELQTLTHKDFSKEDLFELLRDYILREDPAISNEVIKKLVLRDIVSLPELLEIFCQINRHFTSKC
jgi:hypothetical protein